MSQVSDVKKRGVRQNVPSARAAEEVMRITAHEIPILDRVYMAVSLLKDFQRYGEPNLVPAYEPRH